MGSLLQDVRYGLRLLARSPGFAAVAVGTLGLGIGANTAIFSVVNAVVLQPLPYPSPDRLVRIYERSIQLDALSSVSYLNLVDWQQANQSFEGQATYRGESFNFSGAGQPEQIAGAIATGNLFSVLGVPPQRGRSFTPDEELPGAPRVALISEGFWTRRLGSNPGVLGTSLTLDGRAYTIVGVVSGVDPLLGQAEVITPLAQWRRSADLERRESHPGLQVVGRLKPGVSLAQARVEMDAIALRLAAAYPGTNEGQGVTVVALKSDLVGGVRAMLLLLQVAVGFVLLIACANAANLLLARSAGRRREIAVRTALGAGRRRVVRQLLVESVLISLAGGAIGLLLAAWGTSGLLAAVPGALPRSGEVALDASVLLFTLVVSLLTGVVFGLAPALQSTRSDLGDALRESGRGMVGGQRRTQRLFVVSEIALALVLLAGAGLLIRTLQRLSDVNPGLDPRHVLTMQVALSPALSDDPATLRTAWQQLLDRVQSLPDVTSAAVTLLVPLSGDDNEMPFWVGSRPPASAAETPMALTYITTPGYLRTMGIPLLRGRYFTDEDSESSRRVVVIDEVFARDYFPGQDPIGEEIQLYGLGPVEIVGLVGHVRHWGLDADDVATYRDQLYFNFFQIPDVYMAQSKMGLRLVLRTAGAPLGTVAAVGRQVMGPGRDQPVYNVRSMEQLVAGSLVRRRFLRMVLVIFAAVALALAGVGIYGVASYSVSQRAHEIRVRTALGATRGDILALMVREGAALALAGTAAGLVGALLLTKMLKSMLYGVGPADPPTLVAVSLVLALVALLGSYLPARRATQVDPVSALRSE
jgi:predicted permease